MKWETEFLNFKVLVYSVIFKTLCLYLKNYTCKKNNKYNGV